MITFSSKNYYYQECSIRVSFQRQETTPFLILTWIIIFDFKFSTWGDTFLAF